MKMLEVQLAEFKEMIIPAEVKAGFTEQAALTAWSDGMKGKSVEEQVSIAKGKLKKLGISESGKKINRNNGSGGYEITESKRDDLAVEVARLARSYGMSKAEAILMLENGQRLEVYGLSDKQLTEAWKPYAGVLSESEIATLVRGRVAPPVKK